MRFLATLAITGAQLLNLLFMLALPMVLVVVLIHLVMKGW